MERLTEFPVTVYMVEESDYGGDYYIHKYEVTGINERGYYIVGKWMSLIPSPNLFLTKKEANLRRIELYREKIKEIESLILEIESEVNE